MQLLIDREVERRVARLDLPFNARGLDPYGISKRHLTIFFSLLGRFYRHYWRVRCYGIENVPAAGRGILIGNHSGGIPADGGMVLASMMLEADPPRLAHGMVEKFVAQWPFASKWFERVGQLTGLPEHAVRLLEDDRLLMVFPEGARGTGKLYRDRYQLVRFGTGFMRLALQTRSPIIPFAFIGAEEALATMFHSTLLAQIFGAPYWPVPPQIIPFPLPVACQIHYGQPMRFEGTGAESDDVVEDNVEQVKRRVASLIDDGLRLRAGKTAG